MFDWIGWAATATFTTSYFFKNPAVLRRIQAAASLLWLCYGLFIHSMPMIVANAIVAGVAGFSSFRPAGESRAAREGSTAVGHR